MKKRAKELVSQIFHSLKFDIPHPDLEDIFSASKQQAKRFCNMMQEENPERKEKYEMLKDEIDKLTFKTTVYNG